MDFKVYVKNINKIQNVDFFSFQDFDLNKLNEKNLNKYL